MALHPEPSLDELAWTVAAARVMFGPHMNIQVCLQSVRKCGEIFTSFQEDGVAVVGLELTPLWGRVRGTCRMWSMHSTSPIKSFQVRS